MLAVPNIPLKADEQPPNQGPRLVQLAPLNMEDTSELVETSVSTSSGQEQGKKTANLQRA